MMNKYKKFNIRKVIALTLVALLTISLLQDVSIAVASNDNALDFKADISATRSLEVESFEFDDNVGHRNRFISTYTVTPNPIPIDQVSNAVKAKEVVIIVDNSGSMLRDVNGDDPATSFLDSRMTIAKTAATELMTTLEQLADVKVGIVSYANTADVFSYGGDELLDLQFADNVTALKDHINSMVASGGTNIGDALRRADHMFDSSNADTQKYIVFLTDGAPTAFSYDTLTTVSTTVFAETFGQFTEDSGVTNTWAKDITLADGDFNEGSLAATKYFVNFTGPDPLISLDEKGYSLEYSQLMATNLAGKYSNYFVSFSSVDANNKLELIGNNAGAVLKDAMTDQELYDIYDEIGETILGDVIVEDVSFSDTLPTGISYISGPTDMVVSGQHITLDLGEIIYRVEGDFYVADPITFEVVLEAQYIGSFTFGANDTTFIEYLDLDKEVTRKYFNQSTIHVIEPLEETLRLDVLEIQPGRDFELTLGDLQSKFSGYSVTLTQVSMPEFNGMIESVNGNYDFVYLGMNESMANHTLVGASASNTITIDVDLTNKRAEELVEFINSGQCMVIDNKIYDDSTTKAYGNVYSLRNKTNVHNVNSDTNTINTNPLFGWYTTAEHRPQITINAMPTEYNGLDTSYLADHIMSYNLDAYNNDSSEMDVTLYIDYNGDGLFRAEEIAKTRTLDKNTGRVGVAFEIYEDFNGLMPWKLVLEDTDSGSKDEKTGFTAMKGKTTVVRVLNLIPTEASLDFGRSSEFIPPLNVTDKYDIQVTRMLVEEFDANYPNEVNGHPTLLNKNYDMILFGFGDSYGDPTKDASFNKDLDRPEVITAVEDFIATNQSIMFTHDLAGPQDYTNNFDMYNATTSYNDHVNYNDAPNITSNFKDDMGFSNERTSAGQKVWKAWGATSAYKQNEGVITKYPYVLATNPTKDLEIAKTHDQYWKVDLESDDVVSWFNLNRGDFRYYPEAYYYTFTNGSITYSGTGHSKPLPTGPSNSNTDEQELFVNTILKAARTANHAPTIEVKDLYDNINIPPTQTDIDFRIKISDIDVLDVDFNTKVFLVYEVDANGNGTIEASEITSILAFESDDIKKDIYTPVSVPNMLPAAQENFEIIIDVTDQHGATGEKRVPATQKVGDGFAFNPATIEALTGDLVELNLNTTIESAKRDLLGDVSINTNLNNLANPNYYSVVSYPGFTKSGFTYVLNPSYPTGVFSTDDPINLKIGTDTYVDYEINHNGTYKMKASPSDPSYATHVINDKSTISVESGQLNVVVTDVDGYPINGAQVSITNIEVPGEPYFDITQSKTTFDDAATGTFTFDGLSSYEYQVTLSNIDSGFTGDVLVKNSAKLVYGDSSKTVTFTFTDDRGPEIFTDFERPLDQIIWEGDENAAYIEFDGYSSPFADGPTLTNDQKGYRVYKIPYETGGVVNDSALSLTVDNFLSHPDIGSAIDLYDDTSGTFTPDNPRPANELFKTFDITENGFYVFYCETSKGKFIVVKKVSKFLKKIDVL